MVVPWPQLGAKQSKQAGKPEHLEITEIRKPELSGAQTTCNSSKSAGLKIMELGGGMGGPGPMSTVKKKQKKLKSKRSLRLTKPEHRNMRGPPNLQS